MSDGAARETLRARQGAGARYDAPGAPGEALGWARRGTAYFARVLNGLADHELALPSRLPGWSRASIIAHVGYHARALARLVEGVRTGQPLPMYDSDDARAADIALGETLPPRALRHLFEHSEVHLNVEWRDLDDAGWQRSVRGRSGETMAVADTPLQRARVVWVHAMDLNHGGRWHDMPADFMARLLPQLHREAELPARLMPRGGVPIGDGPEIAGAPTDLARWLSGRGARNLEGSLPPVPSPREQG